MKNKTFTRFFLSFSNVKKKKIASLMAGGYLKEDCLPTLVGRSVAVDTHSTKGEILSFVVVVPSRLLPAERRIRRAANNGPNRETQQQRQQQQRNSLNNGATHSFVIG